VSSAVHNGRLQALLDELVAAGASGALARVDDGTHTWRLASGAARLHPRVPLRPSARFRVASVTKTFVATVALQLVGDGILRLDDTVARWVPGLVPNGRSITLRMLLNHTSGLFDYTEDEDFFAQVIADPSRVWSPRELVAIANTHPTTFPPGAGWSYSNTGYIVAGLMIRATTGQGLRQLLTNRIIKPLGLTDTYFAVHRPGIVGYHAHGYLPPSLTGGGYEDITRISPSIAWAAGGIVSTVDDLDEFYAALLGGQVLRRGLLAQMETTVPVLPVVFRYGLGLYAMRGPCGTVWGHDGGYPGYVNVAYHDRSGRRSVLVMMSTESDEQLGSLYQLTVDTAVCQMFGRVPPTSASSPASSVLPLDRAMQQLTHSETRSDSDDP
jgi:D-alanyl-D-alanine carboxypeptidase